MKQLRSHTALAQIKWQSSNVAIAARKNEKSAK